MLDLERCPFIRPAEPSAEPAAAPSPTLRCWAGGQPREIGPNAQRERCFAVLHASCPALLAAVSARQSDGWTANARAARVVSEACLLAEAQLEVRNEQLGPTLVRIFGVEA